MNSVTKYFHNVLKSQCNPRIDFSKDSKFVIIEKEEFENGILSDESAEKYFECLDTKRTSTLDIFIAAKTVKTHFNSAERWDSQPDDLTCVFFIPAKLHTNGSLSFPEKQPMIPREFLEPMIERELSIGHIDRLDRYLSEHTAEFKLINTWKDYIGYSKKMYEFVTGKPFEEQVLTDSIQFDGRYYIFKDEMIVATKGIAELYEDIQNQSQALPLYETLTAMKCANAVELTNINDIESMKDHCAGMEPGYPISPSQRESVIHFNQLKNGEILAVSGPPGTGKTTLLQSIVAGMVTDHALRKLDAPVIVASSTNNQAVTNIIDSFGKIKPSWESSCIESRWLPNINSFSVFFPSQKAQKKSLGYQCIDNKYTFLAEISSEEYIRNAKAFLSVKFARFSGEKYESIQKCKEYLHSKLLEVDRIRRDILTRTAEVAIPEGTDAQEYLHSFDEQIDELQAHLYSLSKEIKETEKKNTDAANRMKEWEASYKNLPFLVRLLPFLKYSKRKLKIWFADFRTTEETTFLTIDTPDLNKVIDLYIQQIRENDTALERIRNSVSDAEKKKKALTETKKQIESKINSILQAAEESQLVSWVFRELDASESKKRRLENEIALKADYSRSILKKCVLSETNAMMDKTLRYLEFWLSVHYYECEFLEQKPLTEKQIGTTIPDVIKKKLRRLAMVAPCMVMTFFKLPINFCGLSQESKMKRYLYNFADLLIADEAGQTSPEIAAASFALAKRAVIVGDEYQIPPVWGTSHLLDISLALEAGVIRSAEDFRLLEESGLNASESSLMRAASQSCCFHKHGPGLFLCEHRRCYNEIIGYCNELIYNGHLKPSREDHPNKLPCLGYHDIPVAHAEKAGTSRANPQEAEAIAVWLNENFPKLRNIYDVNKVKDNEIIAVITPFKAQTARIKSAIKQHCGDLAKNIGVGTVHTFQGAERKVIIFSTVYGHEDNCGFIDGNKNLMNVAVSRAKDAFWVFGSIGCLKDKPLDTASGLMYSYVKNSIINKL